MHSSKQTPLIFGLFEPAELDESVEKVKKAFSLIEAGDLPGLAELKLSTKDLQLKSVSNMTVSLVDWANTNNSQPLLDYFYQIALSELSSDRKNLDRLFLWAINCNQPIKTLEDFLDQGATLNISKGAIDNESPPNKSPIACAIQQNNKPIVEFLLERGADVHDDWWEKFTNNPPLHQAIFCGHKDIVESLVARGADPEQIRHSSTMLGFAASRGHLEIVKCLIEQGAKVNPEISRKMTTSPLHEAAVNRHLEVVKYLVEQGADIHALTFCQYSVLDMAARGGGEHTEMVGFLESKGAKHSEEWLPTMVPIHTFIPSNPRFPRFVDTWRPVKTAPTQISFLPQGPEGKGDEANKNKGPRGGY